MSEIIKSYKGFNKDMTCTSNGVTFQYAEGEEYETERAEVCDCGFHACEIPLDTFKYYQPSKSEYHEVEQSGDISKNFGDSKIASTKIKIGAKIGIKGLVKAQIDFVFDKVKRNNSDNATSGEESSAATSGDWSSAATSGNRSSAATSGEESSAATSGNGSSAATSGNRSSAATSGDWSSAATSGNGSSAATSGEESSAATSNKNAIALACGKNAKAKGVIGSYIVLTEWNEKADTLISAKMVQIDGEIYKADTWYKIKNGEIVEVEEQSEKSLEKITYKEL